MRPNHVGGFYASTNSDTVLLISYFFLMFCVNNSLHHQVFAVDFDAASEQAKRESENGVLYGDIYNWADMIQNYIKQLAYDGIQKDYTQELFDKAIYEYHKMNGTKTLAEVSEELGNYFSRKKNAAQRIATQAVKAYDAQISLGNLTYLNDLPRYMYMDSDNPKSLPEGMDFSPYFKQKVARNQSTVKIADEVPRTLNKTVYAVKWTYKLESVMQKNAKIDKSIRWQYFGSTAGITRLYPGREWKSNFVGFYTDYDPRIRPWYIAATSGPKDVVIVLDCSLSMIPEKFGIAKAVAKAVIKTLTKQDYLNVVCARASHWDEVGKWHTFKSEVLSCKEDQMVPATIAHRKDLMEKIDNLVPGGTSELEAGFQLAFSLLQSKTRTGCQSVLVFVTDGKDTDGETVRCGPGYYTRSGYVPGPVCKYNWTKVWSVVDKRNSETRPNARIFSYLIKDDGEDFPGHMACMHRGSMRKLVTGENLISQLSNYFEFLSKNAKSKRGLWTSPYLDAFGLGLMVTYAVPAISKKDFSTIGVAGVDAPLEEIEMLLTKYQWGSVTSFLIDKEGQTIYHPLLKASTTLRDDPIFIPIQRLEQDREGNPKEFTKVVNDMTLGNTGMHLIQRGRRGTPKGDYRAGVKFNIMPLEYYFTSLNDSDYFLSFVLAETDKDYRTLTGPSYKSYNHSYFNLLIEYNSSIVRQRYPEQFEKLDVRYNEKKYPLLRVSYNYSSIFFAPKCHCEPSKYFFDDNLAKKTLDAHAYMNEQPIKTKVSGCDKGSKYVKTVRAYVLVSQPVELKWIQRKFEWIDQAMWTYVGMRSGVFRTYPGHRSTRLYDPTKRPWYRRTLASPNKISISTPYMDAAGSGKIITISQAVFEGMQNRTLYECVKIKSKKPGGCHCNDGSDCLSGYCYVSQAAGPNKNEPRCATERIEAVTSLDIGYDSFHNKLFDIMTASDGVRSCDKIYTCPDGTEGCQTMCYLFDDRANVIVASDFMKSTPLDTGKYKGVTLGKTEGEIMKELIYLHNFFTRSESIDFQGVCSFVSSSPKVTLQGIPRTPGESDDYYKVRGTIPRFSNSYGCIQDVVSFTANTSALGKSRMLVGNVSGPCMSGFYYLTSMPETNLFLLVIENWRNTQSKKFYNFNCVLTRRIGASGAYRIINGTCAHQDTSASSLSEQEKCPELKNISIPCVYTIASEFKSWKPEILLSISIFISILYFETGHFLNLDEN